MPRTNRKKPHNPHGLLKNTWGYRVCQLRHALGWSQPKFARISGIGLDTVKKFEIGRAIRPELATLAKIQKMEALYADILKVYAKSPARLDRLRSHAGDWNVVKLQPIEVRRPEDIESLGKVEADSEPLFFGRKTRRDMPNTGLSVREK